MMVEINPGLAYTLAGCTGAEISVVLSCLRYLEPDNVLFLGPQRRKEIASLSGIKLNTVNSAVSKLLKKGLLVKVSEVCYVLDDRLFRYSLSETVPSCTYIRVLDKTHSVKL